MRHGENAQLNLAWDGDHGIKNNLLKKAYMKKSHMSFCYFLQSCRKRWGGQGRDQIERKRRKNVVLTGVC